MKILYFVTEDWYFCSHRLPMARAARDAGFEVLVLTRVKDHAAQIEAEGFRLIPIAIERGEVSLAGEWRLLRAVMAVYRRERPDIVHHVAMKPVAYGTTAALLTGVGAVVNALAGLGYLFTSRHLKARVLKQVVRLAFKLLLNRKRVRTIMQNRDDRAALCQAAGVDESQTVIIAGSGVDIARLHPTPEPPSPPIRALTLSRVLWDKGIGELAEAGRILKERGESIELMLAGGRDPLNPACIDEAQVRQWHEAGWINWLGPRSDVAELLAQCHMAILPSHREGLPKALLEAAAAGLPMVANDVPGCREVTVHEQTGLLVPKGDARALADAIARLAHDPSLRAQYGAAARARAETQFAETVVTEQVLALYVDMLGGRRPQGGESNG
ncbi:glycosyltransferase family 4 protein [Magnetofaba australis]|uniref:Putative alpha-D-QuiNAc alpha-1,3-galactosyltransferase n=1 Tax=Magnetofaba australis IT-1 TaxID=1434232 RepID=A0A1Y2K7H3_9PROT|nr:glycosyltransferase family 4 protein [Magnetofaba australis]OSM05308.1 putative alpha-D-QuiNAc alpha-1,3-galactosyltransferase [Magnetofaba australis IT-1]